MWTRRSLETLLASLIALAGSGAVAAADTAAQRARIANERAAVEAQARNAEKACALRFAVSSCVAQARAERRLQLQSLDRRDALLDEAQRRSRAAERLERQRQRQGAVADEPPIADSPSRAPRDPAATDTASERSATSTTRREAAAARAAAEEVDAAKRVAARARRVQEAKAHREAVEQRNRDRTSPRKPALPLPPGGSTASAPP